MYEPGALKLLRQTVLQLTEGKSDKVYEVDLCEVDTGKLVVNFRYGRRGTQLREGTKTNLPVPAGKAEQIFDQLVDSKVAKGYQIVRSGAPARAEAVLEADPAPALPSSDDPRPRRILERLASTAPSNWPLDRVIWRAGELAIPEATPLLVRLLDGATMLRKYSIAWALAHTGAAAPAGTPHRATAIEALEKLAHVDGRTSVERIATEALLMLAPDHPIRERVTARVPPELFALVDDSATPDARKAAKDALFTIADEPTNPGAIALLDLYRLGASSAVVDALQRVSLKREHFRVVRYLFKAAELRRDGEVFGAIVRRIELGRAHWEGGFRPGTRFYLRRRAWRTLRKLGRDGSRQYVPLAAGVLLAMQDEDEPQASSVTSWDWRSRSSVTIYFDRYTKCYAFSRVLRGNSARHFVKSKTLRTFLKDTSAPTVEPPRREEAFPKLWERQPHVLFDLLVRSRCGPVNQFAAQAIRACPDYLMTLDVPAIARLLGRPYEVTARLGFELAKKRYDRMRPDLALLLATANCTFDEARTTAHQWIEEAKSEVQKSASMLADLLTSPREDTRRFAGELFSKIYLSNDVARTCLARVVAELLSPDNVDEAWSADVATITGRVLAGHVGHLSVEVLLDLASHRVAAVQVFAGHVLLARAKLGQAPADVVVEKLLDSSHPSARAVGAELFEAFDDDALLERSALVASLVTSRHEEVRQRIRATAARLAGVSEVFAGTLLVMIVERLTRRDSSEALQRDLHALLTGDLKGYLARLPDPSIWRLLRAPSTAAGDAAGVVLETWSHDKLSMVEIVELASHEVLRVREAAWRLLRADVDRVKAELPQAVRMLDAKWEDSRRAANAFFDEALDDDDFTPEVLVSICDSNREDVQRFGRDLVVRRFDASAAPAFLLKLSEHPSVQMQAFVSGLLTSYAAGHLDRIERLVPYMAGALARVNRGRVAKDRVFDLLEGAIESPEGASIVASLLNDVSNTMAIGDKARAIRILLSITKKHPGVSTPLTVKPVEVRGGV